MKTGNRQGTFSELQPVEAIEGMIAFLKSGFVAMFFALKCLETELWDDAMTCRFNEALAQTVSDLPAGLVIQKLDAYYFKSASEPEHDIGLVHRYQEQQFNRPFQCHRAFLCISLGPKGQARANPFHNGYTVLNPLKDHFKGVERCVAELKRASQVLTDLLRGHDIEVEVLAEEAILDLYLSYYNLEFDKAKQPKTLYNQINPLENGMSMGVKAGRVVTIRKQGVFTEDTSKGRQVTQAFAYPLTHVLGYQHVLITTILVEGQEKSLQALDRKRRLHKTLAAVGSQVNEIAEDEIAEFTEEIRREKHRLVSFNMTVILFEESAERVGDAVEAAVAAFRNIEGCEALVENLDTTALYFANVPGNAFQNYRWLTLSARQAVQYFHWTTLYRSAREGVLLADREGNPVLVDFFAKSLQNFNNLLIGPSGSGKSFLNNYLLALRYEQGHLQIILDIGGSYRHTVQASGGVYFAYDPKEPFPLNPFWVEPVGDGSYRLSSDKMIFLTALLSTIWKQGQINSVERTVLRQFISGYYQGLGKGDFPSLAGFALWLKAYDKTHTGEDEYGKLKANFSVDELCLVLEPFVSGEYKDLFSGAENQSFSSYRLIAFDVEKIKSDRILYPIISLIITEIALELVRAYPDMRKFIKVDEAWSMLSDTWPGFLEYAFRTLRKNNGSISIITQGITEIVNAEIGQVLIDNSSTKIILPQSDETQIKRLGKVLGFTKHELDKIRSLRSLEQGREVYIKMGDYGKVYLVEVAPELAAIFSSRSEERNRLAALIEEKGGNIHYALAQYLEDQQLQKS